MAKYLESVGDGYGYERASIVRILSYIFGGKFFQNTAKRFSSNLLSIYEVLAQRRVSLYRIAESTSMRKRAGDQKEEGSNKKTRTEAGPESSQTLARAESEQSQTQDLSICAEEAAERFYEIAGDSKEKTFAEVCGEDGLASAPSCTSAENEHSLGSLSLQESYVKHFGNGPPRLRLLLHRKARRAQESSFGIGTKDVPGDIGNHDSGT